MTYPSCGPPSRSFLYRSGGLLLAIPPPYIARLSMVKAERTAIGLSSSMSCSATPTVVERHVLQPLAHHCPPPSGGRTRNVGNLPGLIGCICLVWVCCMGPWEEGGGEMADLHHAASRSRECRNGTKVRQYVVVATLPLTRQDKKLKLTGNSSGHFGRAVPRAEDWAAATEKKATHTHRHTDTSSRGQREDAERAQRDQQRSIN